MIPESKHSQVVKLLEQIRPGAVWVFSGETYEGLEWLDQVQTKPTAAELGF